MARHVGIIPNAVLLSYRNGVCHGIIIIISAMANAYYIC